MRWRHVVPSDATGCRPVPQSAAWCRQVSCGATPCRRSGPAVDMQRGPVLEADGPSSWCGCYAEAFFAPENAANAPTARKTKVSGSASSLQASVITLKCSVKTVVAETPAMSAMIMPMPMI